MSDERCEHGHPRDLSDGDWPTCIAPDCPGGSRRMSGGVIRVVVEQECKHYPHQCLGEPCVEKVRRVLSQDQYALIQNNDGGWVLVAEFDALPDHTEGTT